jgi:hypothetical protein
MLPVAGRSPGRLDDNSVTLKPDPYVPPARLREHRAQRQELDPYSEAERDRLLAYFRQRKRTYYQFALTAFWTGARPSELVGLRWGDVDLRAGKLLIRRSRTFGEDNAPKTSGSERTIEMAPFAVDVREAAPRPVWRLRVLEPGESPDRRQGLHAVDVEPGTAPPQSPAAEVLRHAPHLHLRRAEPGLEPQGTGGVLREERPDDREALWSLLGGDMRTQLALLVNPDPGTLPGTFPLPSRKSANQSGNFNGEGGIRTLGRGTTPTHA